MAEKSFIRIDMKLFCYMFFILFPEEAKFDNIVERTGLTWHYQVTNVYDTTQ